MIRPSFTLGGTGGGIANNRESFLQIADAGLRASPNSTVLIEQSIVGWKEFELEIVRDSADNCIVVCTIENVDPMGVHTGDSITVAPALTLTDKEFQRMRDAAFAVLREIGVDTGGANVQFALNPIDGTLLVIEMNPRVSRSSALASKATGFPIAKIAALLAVGYTLDELPNPITQTTPASFEPTLDYVVVKIPRFDFEKFPGADSSLSTAMKSVGEVMAIGRSFEEALQKAYQSLEMGIDSVGGVAFESADGRDLATILARVDPLRLRRCAEALRAGATVADITAATGYDAWFIEALARIIDAEKAIVAHGLPDDTESWLRLKQLGFSDARLARLAQTSEKTARRQRLRHGVQRVYHRVDSCAAELVADTAYLYGSFEALPVRAGSGRFLHRGARPLLRHP